MLEQYPFKSHYFKTKDNYRLHYIDEGEGDPVLMIHGNPTWSFYYRHLIQNLQKNYRAMALDNLGLGLSDKPQDYDYCLSNHIKNLCDFVTWLDLKNITLIVHDWGGPIGLGMALKFPERIKKLVIQNTAAFNSKKIPYRIALCKTPLLGKWIIQRCNGFAYPATFMAVKNKMSDATKKGYLHPYRSYQDRIAIHSFVQDIPLSKRHQTYKVLESIEQGLKKFKCPTLILWGERDFCFTLHFFKHFLKLMPHAEQVTYPNAGHYLLEDASRDCLAKIRNFLK
jgi:haloalkane dehalogenase